MVELVEITDMLKSAIPTVTSGAVSIIILLLVYNFLSGQINRLKKQEILDSNTAFLLNRGIQWLFYILVGMVVFNVLGIQVDFFIGLWVLAGGTIIGFASMNTIGNAIAGLLIMLSRPFKIDDRLYFQDKHVIVEDIDLIYTRMRTLDNVVISVPNQTLIESVIENQSQYQNIRRRMVLTFDYTEQPERINKILIEATSGIDEIISETPPYVWITDFGNFAMEYTLFYHIASSQKILEVDAKVRSVIVDAFKAENIDLRTPNLIQSI